MQLWTCWYNLSCITIQFFFFPLLSSKINRKILQLIFLIEGNSWKEDKVSDDYEWELVSDRLYRLQTVRRAGDIMAMIFLLRMCLTRNLGNIGNHKVKFNPSLSYSGNHNWNRRSINPFSNFTLSFSPWGPFIS